MGEIIFRFKNNPLVFSELLLSSFFINLLALASSLYVIQVLNRYIGYGVNETLITLTLGVMAAIALEYAFRRVRICLAEKLADDRNQKLMMNTFDVLMTVKMEALNRGGHIFNKRVMYWLDCIENAYNSNNIITFLDVPFALLFVLVIFLISPVLGVITLGFLVVIFFLSIAHRYSTSSNMSDVSQLTQDGRDLFENYVRSADTVRLYGHQEKLAKKWRDFIDVFLSKKNVVTQNHGALQASIQSLQALLSVAIYFVGALLVLKDTLTVGSLIGVNILATRSLGPISKFSGLSVLFMHADQALRGLKSFNELPREPTEGVMLNDYNGRLTFKNVYFGYSAEHLKNSGLTTSNVINPLFESLSFDISKGSMLFVTGGDGEGKTTLAKLVAGLLEPQRGQILVDGVGLRQLAPQWWRRQLVYLPQEPDFLNETFYDNIITDDSKGDCSRHVSQVINAVGLDRFIDQSISGLHTHIENNGNSLALGYRKRLAIARSLAVNGKLVVMDEPTEGLDEDGKRCVYHLLLGLSKQGKTLIVMSQDPVIKEAADYILDLDIKPSLKFYRNQ